MSYPEAFHSWVVSLDKLNLKHVIKGLFPWIRSFSNGDIVSLSAARSRRSCTDYVNSLTHEGESACFLAAKHGHLAVVRLLLRTRANIDQLTNDLSCPLYAGMPCVRTDDLNICTPFWMDGWMNYYCFFLLSAVEGGFEKIVELLVRKGAKVNEIHTASCWTCLHQAVYKVMKGVQIHVGDSSLLLRYSHVHVFQGSQRNRAHPGERVRPGGSRRSQDLSTVFGCSVWTEGVFADSHRCRCLSVLHELPSQLLLLLLLFIL